MYSSCTRVCAHYFVCMYAHVCVCVQERIDARAMPICASVLEQAHAQAPLGCIDVSIKFCQKKGSSLQRACRSSNTPCQRYRRHFGLTSHILTKVACSCWPKDHTKAHTRKQTGLCACETNTGTGTHTGTNMQAHRHTHKYTHPHTGTHRHTHHTQTHMQTCIPDVPLCAVLLAKRSSSSLLTNSCLSTTCSGTRVHTVNLHTGHPEWNTRQPIRLPAYAALYQIEAHTLLPAQVPLAETLQPLGCLSVASCAAEHKCLSIISACPS